jgi:hypothetical protein
MVACWLLRTPLGALYFNLSWPLARRHPPRLRDSADFDEVDSEWLCYFQPALPVRRNSLGYGEPFAID